MPEKQQLKRPWMVAVWPGMGHVALNAGIYLLARLGMEVIAELEADDLFDVDAVEVSGGIVQPGRRPRNRLFAWNAPEGGRDLVLFLGEAQPAVGKYGFCRQLIGRARELGVERVFTFAAMATDMRPEQPARVFAAATDREGLAELKRLELRPLEDGQVGGLNGVLLGAAAEEGLRGACLLGEMPHVFRQLPFPKASLAILEAFAALTGLDLDLADLAGQARENEAQLGELLTQMERELGQGPPAEEEEAPSSPAAAEGLSPSDEKRLEDLFRLAASDRSKAVELKQELDRLGVFKQYEDRFLDLFRKAG